MGQLPDRLYDITKHLQLTFSVTDSDTESIDIENIVPYASKIIIINCKDFESLEDSLLEATNSPYWNPHAQVIVYYHTLATDENARIFFIFWFYMVVNAVIVQYDDSKELLFISYYTPYVTENNKFENMHGCWRTTKAGRPINGYNQSFACEKDCHNVTLNSKLRALHLGTCIGYNTHFIRYDDISSLRGLNIYDDISENLQGFVMSAYGNEVEPFLNINVENDGSYTLGARDGLIWQTLSELMNFTINFDSHRESIKASFNYTRSLQMVFALAERRLDLLICPIYQFDLVIVQIDLSREYSPSGVCVISHRANFETVLFDVNLLQQNSTLIIQFTVCFCCIWLLFYIYNVAEGHNSFNQLGKDFINTIRNILSITLYKPPTRRSFRIFLTISIWCFFILNFGIQAAIVSFFSVYKRGKEVDTFEDVLEKGYTIEAFLSPDMILPDTEKIFIEINSRVKSVMDMYECIIKIASDSERFCLIDCSIGLYLERNRLNEKGAQYLHVARKNRIHNYYLANIYHKNSPLTARMNIYIRRFVEMGLVKKWEQYKFTEMKVDFPVKSLSMKDMLGIFECLYLLLGVSFIIFILEIALRTFIQMRRWLAKKITHWKRTKIAKRQLRHERKAGNIQLENISTQTF